MLTVATVKEYAAKPPEAILSSGNECRVLTHAFFSYVLTGQNKQAVALYHEISSRYGFDEFKTELQQALGNQNIEFKPHLALGQLIRKFLSPLHQPASQEQEADLEDDQFTYVMGTSNARGFGSSPYCFSIFAYVGWQTFVLNEEKFEECTQRTLQIVERLCPGKPIILILGSEPRLLLENRFKLRDREFGGLEDSDYKYMEEAARKYKEMGLKILEKAKGPFSFLVPMPTFNEDANVLSRYMIKHLKQELEGAEIGLVDPYDLFLEPGTETMDEALQSSRDENELHFNHEGLMRIIGVMADLGMVPDVAKETPDFQWNNLIPLNVAEGNEVRIWNDPAKSMKSGMAASTMMGNNFLDYITGYYARADLSKIMVLNAAQGFIPLGIPAELSGGIISVSGDHLNVQAAKRLFHFTGRPDITACEFDDVKAAPENYKGAEALVVYVQPEDDKEQLAEQIRFCIEQYDFKDVFLFFNPDTPLAFPAETNLKPFRQSDFENRHLVDEWKKFRVVHLKSQEQGA